MANYGRDYNRAEQFALFTLAYCGLADYPPGTCPPTVHVPMLDMVNHTEKCGKSIDVLHAGLKELCERGIVEIGDREAFDQRYNIPGVHINPELIKTIIGG